MDSTHLNGPADKLLRPGEAADMFGVDPKTLARWCALGLLRARRTVGGKRRYWKSQVEALAAELDEAVA